MMAIVSGQIISAPTRKRYVFVGNDPSVVPCAQRIVP